MARLRDARGVDALTIWLLMSVAVTYDCPWGLSKAPAAVKQLVCTADLRLDLREFATKEAALAAIEPRHELWQVVREGNKIWKRKVPVQWKPS